MARWLRWTMIAAGMMSTPDAVQAQSGGGRDAPAVAPMTSGRLKLLTYNVAGLPEGLSRSRPTRNLPIIGKLLNGYDLALVQEDFAYPTMLREHIRHAHASPPFERGEQMHFGDGLSQFARRPFEAYEREAWTSCHGLLDSCFDCLTPKGFTYSRQEIAPGIVIDVYNLHMDAGRGPGDRRARGAQIEQLARAVLERSKDQAVVVGGDFNLSIAEDAKLTWLESKTGLRDACKSLRCGQPARIDRILFRGSETLRLSPRSWRTDSRFVDAARRPLSDHLAVAVDLEWRVHDIRVARANVSPATIESDTRP